MVVLFCLALPAVSSAAATYSVNTTADGPGECETPGATCTLRGALAAFEASAETEGTIIVPPGHYTLTEGELSLGKGGELNLVGAGARRTVVDAAGGSRVFAFEGTSTPTAAFSAVISGMTITGGVETTEGIDPGDGGGIVFGNTAEELVLEGVAVSGNTATINGGGVAAPLESGVAKTVVVENSTISGNKIAGGVGIGLGGGVFVTGDLEMVNSTVTGNAVENGVAANEGGGIVAGPGTGTTPTETTLINSTIAGNSVSSGTGGGFSMYNPTAIAESSSVIVNTIIAGNTAAGMSADCGGALTVISSHDLSSDESCMFSDAGSKKSTDPMLGPLANNGGETDTLALPAGSPAIDAGTAEGCPTTDQRGVARPLGSACDIGAYEYQPPVVTPPSQPTGASPPTTADLALKIKPKPKKPRRGKKFGFLVTVRDAGPAAAPGVVFKGTVPAAARKVKVKGLAKNACKLGKVKKHKRTLTCQLGTITVGKALQFRIPVKTKNAPRKLLAKGTVVSGVTDPTPGNSKAKAVAKLKG